MQQRRPALPGCSKISRTLPKVSYFSATFCEFSKIFQNYSKFFQQTTRIFVIFFKSGHTYCMLRDLIRPYLPDLIRREMTNRDLAKHLGVSETHLCRVLKQLKVVKNPAVNGKAKRELNAARREFRTFAATTMDIKAAADAAGCSTRTIYRLRNKK